MAHLALAEFLVATAMGAAALSVFLWAAFSGMWREVEAVKHEVLRRELGKPPGEGEAPPREGLEEYAGGEIQERSGTVPRWLVVVYVLLAAWALWYLVYAWGGLGPGLDY